MPLYKKALFDLKRRIRRLAPDESLEILAAISVVRLDEQDGNTIREQVLPPREGKVIIRRESDGEYYDISLRRSSDYKFGLCKKTWQVVTSRPSPQTKTQRYLSTTYSASWGKFQVNISPLHN